MNCEPKDCCGGSCHKALESVSDCVFDGVDVDFGLDEVFADLMKRVQEQ
jgi:hypothetical protein